MPAGPLTGTPPDVAFPPVTTAPTAPDLTAAAAVVDLAGHLEATGALDDRSLRPDGIHFTEETSYDMARTWLGDQVAMAADGTGP